MCILRDFLKKVRPNSRGIAHPGNLNWRKEICKISIKGRSGPRVGDVFGMNILGTCGGQFGG